MLIFFDCQLCQEDVSYSSIRNTTRLVDFPDSSVSLPRHLLKRYLFSGLCMCLFGSNSLDLPCDSE